MHPDSGISVEFGGDIKFRGNSPDVGNDSLVDFHDASLPSVNSVESMKDLDKHLNLIGKLRRTKERRLGVNKNEFCEEHNLRKTQFCKEDRVFVCLKCLVYGEHINHSSLDLDIEEQRAECNKILDEERLKKKKEIVDQIGEVWKILKDRLQNLFLTLEKTFNEILHEIYKKTENLLESTVSNKAILMAEVDPESFLQYLQSLEIIEGQLNCDTSTFLVKLPQISFPPASTGFIEPSNNISEPEVMVTYVASCPYTDSTISIEDGAQVNGSEDELESLASIMKENSLRAGHEIYIGNYPVTFEESDVRKLFDDHDVKVGKIRLKQEGLKTFAFAETEDLCLVEKAKSSMHGTVIHGRKLRVGSSPETLLKRYEEIKNERREEVEDRQSDKDEGTIEEMTSEIFVDILHVETPDKIFLRRKIHLAEFETLQSELTKEGTKADLTDVPLENGDYVLCQNEDTWCRGVLKSTSDGVLVQLVDLGMTVPVERQNLKKLPLKLRLVKCLTECVSLANVETCGASGDVNWPYDAVRVLREKLLRKCDSNTTSRDIIMKPITDDGDVVELFIKRSILENPFEVGEEICENVSEYLIKKGVAFRRGVRERILKNKERLRRLSAQFEEIQLPTEPTNIADAPPCYHVDNVIPQIPVEQVFKAKVLHMDKNAVVWVMPEKHMDDLIMVRELCKGATQKQLNVELGELYVIKDSVTQARGRVLKLEMQQALCIDIDSGKLSTCYRDNIFKIPEHLLKISPLALPTKMYGVYRTNLELDLLKLMDELNGCNTTVSVLEPNIDSFPLPVNIWYGIDGITDNLAKFMLQYGFVRVCTSHEEWEKEYSSHDLQWMVTSPHERQHEVSHLPFPLPVSVGMWLPVKIEGIEYPLDVNYKEIDADVGIKDCNLVACRIREDENTVIMDLKDLKESMRIIRKPCEELQNAFERLRIKLDEEALSCSRIEILRKGQEVLAFYEGEWCRGSVEFITPEFISVFFTDYGHRGAVSFDNIRELEERFVQEPIFIKELRFGMPSSNKKLDAIRRRLMEGDAEIFARVDKIVPRGYPDVDEIIVSFWKAVEDKQLGSNLYRLTHIC